MNIVLMLLIGLAVGLAAAWLTPTRDPGGLGTTLLLAIFGSFAAGLLDRVVGWHRQLLDGPSMMASVIGAMFALFIFRLAVRWRARTVG
jgi:uncharacterized membrane protein YeaQ/YmgE (transglycosylase-associated protein family)